jgi:hypothetical protein
MNLEGVGHERTHVTRQKERIILAGLQNLNGQQVVGPQKIVTEGRRVERDASRLCLPTVAQPHHGVTSGSQPKEFYVMQLTLRGTRDG